MTEMDFFKSVNAGFEKLIVGLVSFGDTGVLSIRTLLETHPRVYNVETLVDFENFLCCFLF